MNKFKIGDRVKTIFDSDNDWLKHIGKCGVVSKFPKGEWTKGWIYIKFEDHSAAQFPPNAVISNSSVLIKKKLGIK